MTKEFSRVSALFALCLQCVAGLAQELRIGTPQFAADGMLQMTFAARTNKYYSLLKRDYLDAAERPAAYVLPTASSGWMNVPDLSAATAFYRIAEHSFDNPADGDGDGIDDLYELLHLDIMNPIDADSFADPDADGRSNLDEYYRGTNPSIFDDRFSAMLQSFDDGSSFVVALRSTGTMWACGSNASGSMGLGNRTGYFDDPIPIATERLWRQVSVETSSSRVLAISADHSLWGWGEVQGWGNGALVPTRIGEDTNWIAISSGSLQSLALRNDGTLWLLARSSATKVPTLVNNETDWIAITAGGRRSFAIKADGSLWGWGENAYGAIGDGTQTERTQPVRVGNEKDWQFVATGSLNTLGIRTNGTLWVWGNLWAELGNSTVFLEPTRIDTGTNWLRGDTGFGHWLLQKRDGTLWARGNNYASQFGNGSREGSTSDFVRVGSGWAAVRAGSTGGIGVARDGRLWLWGSSRTRFASASVPQRVAAPPEAEIVRIAAGEGSSFAITADGRVFGWGANSYGCLGLGAGPDVSVITEIPGLSAIGMVAGASSFSLAIDQQGQLFGWGLTFSLGVGKSEEPVFLPSRISARSWISISAVSGHTVGVQNDGSLWSWGSNTSGALGDGSTTDSRVPLKIGEERRWRTAFAGNGSSFAIADDGSLWAWGANPSGQLGIGTTQDAKLPIQVGSDTNWLFVAQRQQHTIGLKTDGTMWVWGSGDGTSASSKVPFEPMPGTQWKSVSAGERNYFAVRSKGTLWSWGRGSLGDGTSTRAVPGQVGTESDWEQVSSGRAHTVALKSDGTVRVWGSGTLGQLGDGRTLNVPDLANPSTNWASWAPMSVP